MRSEKCDTKEEALEKARLCAEQAHGDPSGSRPWLVGAAPDSYGEPQYRTEVHVWEGSPPKGYVFITGDDRHGDAMALNCTFLPIKRFLWPC
jgi:hypothetical protein